jgi:GNAT superfamily N-acetyltransferase
VPALAENHFAFMAAQRGSIRRTATSIELIGRAEFLSWWTPLTSSAEVPESARCVRLFSWHNESWSGRLHDLGFTATGQLSYMEAPLTPGRIELPEGVSVAAVAADEDAVAFSETQAEGFLSPNDPMAQWWRPVLREVALHNYQNPAEHFYLLRYAGEPAAVSLTLTTGRLSGIYAVATPPMYRRRGFATVLLERIRHDAHRRGDTTLGLQVEVGSAAEHLYLKAGFTSSFLSTIYER